MKLLMSIALGLALFIATPAAAQQDEDPMNQHAMGPMPDGGMMQAMQACMMMMHGMHSGATTKGTPGGGMMQGMSKGDGMMGMMQDPMHHSLALSHILPTMQEPLNLDDAQVDRLQRIHEDHQAVQADRMERVRVARAELNSVMAQEDPDASRLEALLKSAAEAHAEMQASMVSTAQQMKDVLSAEQRAALDEMEPSELHRHMMQNMSMMDMMQMMKRMHGGMMSQHTGHGGMMGPGAMPGNNRSQE